MYKIPLPLTKENVFNKISSYQVFKRYCSNFKEIGEKFVSDIRADDSNPSACISKIHGDLLYTDFGKGSYRAINYVMEKFNLSFFDALKKLNYDFGLDLGFFDDVLNKEHVSKIPDINISKIPDKQNTIIKIKSILWNSYSLKYWTPYAWTKEMLEAAAIKPISHFWIYNERIRQGFIAGNFSYSIDYYWHQNVFRRKLYFPLKEKSKRFLTNADYTVVQGHHLLPKTGGELLIISKSIKDCGIFWKLGIYAISPNTENMFLPEEYIIKLKKRWKRIVIWFDNDETGINKGKKFGEKYGLEYVTNPIDSPYKDPSDYVKELGLQEFHLILNNILLLCRDIYVPLEKILMKKD